MSCFWNWFGKKDKETDEVEAIGGESSPVQATPVEAWGAQSDSPRDPTTADVETVRLTLPGIAPRSIDMFVRLVQIQPDSEGKRKSIARQPVCLRCFVTCCGPLTNRGWNRADRRIASWNR